MRPRRPRECHIAAGGPVREKERSRAPCERQGPEGLRPHAVSSEQVVDQYIGSGREEASKVRNALCSVPVLLGKTRGTNHWRTTFRISSEHSLQRENQSVMRTLMNGGRGSPERSCPRSRTATFFSLWLFSIFSRDQPGFQEGKALTGPSTRRSTRCCSSRRSRSCLRSHNTTCSDIHTRTKQTPDPFLLLCFLLKPPGQETPEIPPEGPCSRALSDPPCTCSASAALPRSLVRPQQQQRVA